MSMSIKKSTRRRGTLPNVSLEKFAGTSARKEGTLEQKGKSASLETWQSKYFVAEVRLSAFIQVCRIMFSSLISNSGLLPQILL